ncbi:MAG: hypothetical protein JXK07_09980 [Spirochaetes bacterium]|nr:hypothetical protein [Spirochaetota bacterium]MBN2771274.1 hypothetical protein [Spirochaetota bacterium]
MKNYRITDEKLKELEPKIREWKEMYPDRVTMIKLGEDPVDLICKVPDASLMEATFENNNLSDYKKNLQLCLDCVLYPEIDTFNQIIAEKDTLPVPIARQLVQEAGTAQKVTTKKL